jgi:transposase
LRQGGWTPESASGTVAVMLDESNPSAESLPAACNTPASPGVNALVAILERDYLEYLQLKEENCRLQKENLELRTERGYWRAMHERSLAREADKDKKIEKLEAQLNYLTRKKYDKSNEKSAKSGESAATNAAPSRPRGQQPGSESHGRTCLEHLPRREEEPIEHPHACCPRCGLAYKELSGTEDSEQVEVEVRAYRRLIRRKRYHRTCECPEVPEFITTPAPGKLIPKGKLGISIWVELILMKYVWAWPLNRLLQYWLTVGIDISSGTIIGGLQFFKPLLEPVVGAFHAHQLTEGYAQADETTWKVFEQVAGKVGNRWYLWVFRTKCSVVFRMAPGRGAEVPTQYYAGLLVELVLVCDRYSAYKKMARIIGILLAFCWAHQRRDFIDLGRDYPVLSDWADAWVKRIGTLYHLYDLRQDAQQIPLAWLQADTRLREHVKLIEQERDRGLADPTLHPRARKVLTSMQRHWHGLTVFVDRLEVAIDNNASERVLRPEAQGRKAYYGSGSVWAAELAALLFSVLRTLVDCWQINPRRWLQEYLQACADNGGRAVQDLSGFLPWKMSPERLRALRQMTPADTPLSNTA